MRWSSARGRCSMAPNLRRACYRCVPYRWVPYR